ncbi:MAG: hypothetical protein JXR58_00930 [Bacteroidales bacterium]|nr:hypothetical protein [Bacteroidales bacterium]
MKKLISLAVIISSIFVGCKSKPAKDAKVGNENGNDSIQPVTGNSGVETIKRYSKTEIKKMLTKLAETPAPTDLSFGAMCYDMAMPPPTVEYVCPVCGEKTLYNEDQFFVVNNIQNNLDGLRHLSGKIEQINLKIDESQFCKTCSPNVETPAFCLLTNIPGTKDTTKICNVSDEDLVILLEFLNGKLKHTDFYERETPLKERIERLEQLLGVELN